MAVLHSLVDTDKAGLTVVWGDLDFVVADVDKSLDCLDLSVAVFDSCTWRCIAVIVRGRMACG